MYGQHNSLGRIGKLNPDFRLEWKLNYGKNINIATGFNDMILSRNKLIAVGSYVDTSRTIWGTQNGYSVGWTGIADTFGDSICEVFDTAHWFTNLGRAMGVFRTMDTLSSGSIITCGDGWFGQLEDTYNEYAWLVKMPNPPCEGLKVGNKEISNAIHNWKINPNPAKESALLYLDHGVFNEAILFNIFNNLGQIVKKAIADIGVDQVTIDLRNLREGIYIVQSINKTGQLTGVEKLIIVK
jgi:hypothetical protein